MTLLDRINGLAPFVMLPQDASQRVVTTSTILDVDEYLRRVTLFSPAASAPTALRTGIGEQNAAEVAAAAAQGGYISAGAFDQNGDLDQNALHAAIGIAKPVTYYAVAPNAWDAMSPASRQRVPQIAGLFRQCAVVTYSWFFPVQAGRPFATVHAWEGRWSAFSVLLQGPSFIPLVAGFHGLTDDPASPNGVRLVKWDAIQLAEDVGAVARPVVYAAKGTNTLYERPGRYPIDNGLAVVTGALEAGWGDRWTIDENGNAHKDVQDNGDLLEVLVIVLVVLLGSCIAGAANSGEDHQTSGPPRDDEDLTPIAAETPLDPVEVPLFADTVPQDGHKATPVGPVPSSSRWWAAIPIRWGLAQLNPTQAAVLDPGRVRETGIADFLDAMASQGLPITLG